MTAGVDLVAERSPWGGLERWLHDPAVTEVMVNAGCEVWVERGGRVQRVGTIRPATVLGVVEHLLAPLGRRLDRAQPAVDARLPDGARLCAVIEPVAVDGPCLSVRRFATHPISLEGFAPAEVAALLRSLVEARCNVLVSGATSSGKTTLLNALAGHIHSDARIITLEDVAELRLAHPHVVRLETRDATPDGVGAVTLSQLVRTALRLRPDRLVVGEVRGAEAVHLLQALNTGHDGSLCTIHANSADDALDRLASLVLQEVPAWPMSAVGHHVARAVDVVVHVERRAEGRRVAEVREVCPPQGRDGGFRTTLLADAHRVIGVVSRGRP